MKPKPDHATLRLRRQISALIVTVLLVPAAAFAQGTGSWSGFNNTPGSSQNWSNTDNWYSNYGPGQGAKDLQFGNTAQTTAFNNLTGYNGFDINFYDRGVGNNTTFTLNGNAITLFDFNGNSPFISNNSYVTQKINMGTTFSSATGAAFITVNNGDLRFDSAAIALSGSTVLTLNGNSGNTIYFGQTVTNGGNTVQVTGNENVTFNGNLTGTGSFTKGGSGTATFNAATTYSGTTTINASGGTINAAAAGSLGSTSGITVNSGGTLLLSNSGTSDRINNSATMVLNAGSKLQIGAGLSEGTRPTGPGNPAGAAVGVGALTLTGTMASHVTIDFGSGNGSTLFFSSLAAGVSLQHLRGHP